MKNIEIKISFTKEEDYWYDRPDVKVIKNLIQLKRKFPQLLIPTGDGGGLMYIGFVSNFGIVFEYSGNLQHLIYSYPDPDSEVMRYLCEGNFLSSKSNAKLWFCALRYSIENEKCKSFWEMYKDTVGGSRFMSILFGSK